MNEDTREVMLILQEECAEVTQAISKCMRFGPDQMKPGKERTNISMLEEEIGDLMCMLQLMEERDLIDWSRVSVAAGLKREKLKTWSNIK